MDTHFDVNPDDAVRPVLFGEFPVSSKETLAEVMFFSDFVFDEACLICCCLIEAYLFSMASLLVAYFRDASVIGFDWLDPFSSTAILSCTTFLSSAEEITQVTY